MKLERGGTLPPGIAKRDLPGNVVANCRNAVMARSAKLGRR